MLTFFAFIIVFGILVFAHELGHFFMARRLGVKVEEFGFGFPPRLWSKKKGDTIYSVNMIPVGGFVKMYGDQGEDGENKQSFASKTKLEKSLIMVAGVLMNIVLACFLLSIAYGIGFQALFPGMDNHYGVRNDQRVVITKVEEDSPAAKVLQPGDVIKSVAGENIYIDREISFRINEATEGDKSKSVDLVIIRNGEEMSQKLKTKEAEVEENGEKIKVRKIGIGLETKGKIQSPFYLAPIAAFSETLKLTKLTFAGILDFFGGIISKFTISEGVVGPAGIVTLTGSFAQAGIMPLIQFMAILSISLAVLNIMPIPALDGGHLLILLVERIKGKDLSNEAKNIVQFAGFAALITLMIVITVRDLTGIIMFESIKSLFN